MNSPMTNPAAITTRAHCDDRLGPVYAWIVGGIDPALARGADEIAAIGDIARGPDTAIDLGAGFGMHAIPLARNGLSVFALDTCGELLAALEAHRGNLAVETIGADLPSFRRHRGQQRGQRGGSSIVAPAFRPPPALRPSQDTRATNTVRLAFCASGEPGGVPVGVPGTVTDLSLPASRGHPEQDCRIQSPGPQLPHGRPTLKQQMDSTPVYAPRPGTPYTLATRGRRHEHVRGLAMDTLVDTVWLSRHLGEPDLVVLDCSVHTEVKENGQPHNSSGRADYERGHIPTAAFADLTADLSDLDAPIEFALPTPERFCAAMGALGVGDDSRVVLYDATYAAWAARVWWMLRWVGFDRAALLDGGLRAWTAEGRPVSTDPARNPARRLTPAPRPESIADRDEVRAAIGDTHVQLVDSLPAAMYRGEASIYARAGHIPGAVNIPGTELLDESGHFRAHHELAALHSGDRSARTITYCGGGILASSSAFVMTRLGFTDVAVYTASLQEWAAEPGNPMAVGSA